MKYVTVLMAIIFSALAYADTRIEHDYSGALRGLDLYNACITDTEVRSIKPISVCTELVPVERGSGGDEGRWIDWVCEKWEKQSVAYPREYSTTTCTDYVYEYDNMFCRATAEVPMFLPEVIKIRVVTEYGESSNWPGVERSFAFPSCQ